MAAWPGVDDDTLTATAKPASVVAVGDYICQFTDPISGPVLGSKTFVVLHVPTATVRAFNYFASANYSSRPASAVAHLGKAYFSAGWLFRVDPVGGSVTQMPGSPGSALGGSTATVSVGDYLWGVGYLGQIYGLNTVTNVAVSPGVACDGIGVSGGDLFTVGGSTVTQRSPTTGASMGAWGGMTSSTDKGRAVLRSGVLWWPTLTGFAGFDTATSTPTSLTLTPPGFPWEPRSGAWALGPDGNIYTCLVLSGTAYLVVVNPDTGEWLAGDLPRPGYQRPAMVAVADGKLWSPCADPIL